MSDNEQPEAGAGRAVADIALYAVARLLLAVALFGVIYGVSQLIGLDDIPLYVAAAFAIVIALPLGIWLFAPLRRRATARLAVVDERRRRDREQLQARLRGEEPPAE